MNIGRIFANAVARRVAALLVVAVLASLGLGEAHAANCSSPADGCTKPHAYELCLQAVDATNAQNSLNTNRCADYKSNKMWMVETCYIAYGNCGPTGNGWSQVSNLRYYYASECPAGQVWNGITNNCQESCTGKPSSTTPFLPATGSTQCFNGCVAVYAQNSDETSTRSYTGAMCGNDDFKKNCPSGSFWNGYMAVCEPLVKDCPEGQQRVNGVCQPTNKCPEGMIAVQGSTPGAIQQGALYCKAAENECPPGSIKSPSGQCLPGEGQCAAGEARRANGTCGKDKNGDGVADDDDDDPSNDSEKSYAAGGDTCNAPPSCSGDAIACMQVKIQWRIDCNTRSRANVSGGSCAVMPVCTGDGCKPMEHAQLIQQWKAACALEKLLGKGEGAGGDDGLKEYLTASKQAEGDALRGMGNSTGHEGVDESKIWKTFGNGDFDPNMFGGGGGGQCSLAGLELLGHSIDPGPRFWQLAGMIGWLIVACAYLWVAFQLGG